MSGPQCCDKPPTLNTSCGTGSLVELGDLKTYATGSSSDSNLSILLVSDVFGYEAPNLRKLANKVASAGYYVVVPDFLHGDPYVADNAKRPLGVWRQSHGTDNGFEDAKSVIEALKNKGISTIGAAGFCWGAKPEVKGYVKIFHGVTHGWSVRYNDKNMMEVKCAEEAHQNMMDWFAEYLKREKRILAKF